MNVTPQGPTSAGPVKSDYMSVLLYVLDTNDLIHFNVRSARLTEKKRKMDEQRIEQLELAASRADQPRSRLHISAQQRKTILISLGCGVLQLPIWGV